MAAMAEFLARGWNVAVPEVDIGDDLFVVRDRDGKLFRVQVKTAAIRERRDRQNATFSVSFRQLTTPSVPELTYVFVTRHHQKWQHFLVIDRTSLDREHQVFGAGSLTAKRKNVIFNLSFSAEAVTCSGQDFSRFLDNWVKWDHVES